MKNRAGGWSDLKTTFATLKFLAFDSNRICPATRASTGVKGIENEFQTCFVGWKVFMQLPCGDTPRVIHSRSLFRRIMGWRVALLDYFLVAK